MFLRIPSGHYMCLSISPDCHLLELELVLVLSYHFISSGQTNTRRSSVYCAVLIRFSHVRLFVTLWTVAHQVPLSMGFSRQEYWSGLPFPSPVHTLLCIKQENNKDLLYSAGNYTQYLVITSKGEESEKEHLYIYMYN